MSVRPVRPDDVPAVVGLVRELAEYERARDEVRLTERQLHECLFGEAPALFGHVAVAGNPFANLPRKLWFALATPAGRRMAPTRSDLLALLAQKTGMSLTVDRSVADDKLIVFGPARPLIGALDCITTAEIPTDRVSHAILHGTGGAPRS